MYTNKSFNHNPKLTSHLFSPLRKVKSELDFPSGSFDATRGSFDATSLSLVGARGEMFTGGNVLKNIPTKIGNAEEERYY